MKKIFQFTIVDNVILYGVAILFGVGLHNFIPRGGESFTLSGGYLSCVIAGILLTVWVLVRTNIKKPELEISS